MKMDQNGLMTLMTMPQMDPNGKEGTEVPVFPNGILKNVKKKTCFFHLGGVHLEDQKQNQTATVP